MGKKKYIEPCEKVYKVAIRTVLMAGSAQTTSIGFGESIDSNDTQGTDFEVESRGNNGSVWESNGD